jgi:hypothetical protein
MVKSPWRDRLREELRKRNLPPAYAARLIEELADHVTDLEQENPSMDAQLLIEEKLGTPESLAEAAAAELAGRTFAGRHPVLMFLVAPIPAVVLTLAAVLIVCQACKLAVTPLAPVNPNPPTAFEWALVYGIVFFQRFAPFALTAWLFLAMARRAGRPVWGITACALVALFAFAFRTGVLPPTFKRNLTVWFGPPNGLHQWQIGLLQSAVPLALGLWAWRRMTRHAWPASAPSGS